MEKLLNVKEKWAYAHWSIWPGIFWLISPYFWIAAFLTGLIASLSIDLAIKIFTSFMWPYLSAVWYGRAVAYCLTILYAVLCIIIGFGCVYWIARLWFFFYDKDEICQKHFKRYHICKNWACWNCDKESCPAKPERS